MEEKAFLKDGYTYITEKIDLAIQDESRTAIISGCWEIDREIRLPSNFTLILEDCHLKMAAGCYSNMFVNQNHDTALGASPEGTDRNISIIGRGTAILDGGEYNGLSESTHSKNGLPPIWKNNLLLFTNVDGFKIAGIACHNQRWWALNFIYCAHGYIGNTDFCANDSAIDEEGNIYRGLKRGMPSRNILVRNADGIDLRRGCHDILIENITGFTEDDTIALTALNGRMERLFSVDGFCGDIYNIEIRNIRACSFCAIVRLLNQGGPKLHDIVIDGVYDMVEGSTHMDRGLYAVRIGDARFYGIRNATEDETYNITVKNVRGRGKSVLSLAGAMKNVLFYGLEAFHGATMLVDQRNQ